MVYGVSVAKAKHVAISKFACLQVAADCLVPGILDVAIDRAGYPILEAVPRDLHDAHLHAALTAGAHPHACMHGTHLHAALAPGAHPHACVHGTHLHAARAPGVHAHMGFRCAWMAAPALMISLGFQVLQAIAKKLASVPASLQKASQAAQH